MTSRYLITKDVTVLGGISLYLKYRDEYVKFQFPPTVTNDSRRLNWNTNNIPGFDPLAIYESNSAREMSLKIEYIVESQSLNNDAGIWSIGKIKHNINLIKGYFSALTDEGGFIGGTLVAYFKHTFVTGPEPWSVRIGNVNVTYEGPYIGTGYLSYPLKTIVNIDIATVSNHEDNESYWDGIKRAPVFSDLWY